MPPPFWSQAAGLLLFVLLVLAAAGVHRLYLRRAERRVRAAAERPLPGRTRDLFPSEPGRAS